MTQEEKDLIWKDLCARFPYGVRIKRTNCPITLSVTGIDGKYIRHIPFYIGGNIEINTSIIEEIKPYLRPMSSMTEEEYKEWRYLYLPLPHDNEATETQRRIDWLNAHHFDYRGLIEKGLALEAPEDMYKN